MHRKAKKVRDKKAFSIVGWKTKAIKRLRKIYEAEEKINPISKVDYVRLECSVCALAIGLVDSKLLKRTDIRFGVSERFVLCHRCAAADRILLL